MVDVRHIGNCLKADAAYAKGVAGALGLPLKDVPKKIRIDTWQDKEGRNQKHQGDARQVEDPLCAAEPNKVRPRRDQ
jgi:hypothetical protein